MIITEDAKHIGSLWIRAKGFMGVPLRGASIGAYTVPLLEVVPCQVSNLLGNSFS
jgi:hypothetical protein